MSHIQTEQLAAPQAQSLTDDAAVRCMHLRSTSGVEA